MFKTTTRLRRTAVMLLVGMGIWAMAVNPATARELCSENPGLALIDGNSDGVISIGEIQALIDAAGDAEGVDQLQSLLNQMPGDVTGIRYVDCAEGETGAGNGSGDDGTSNGGGDNGGAGNGGTNTGDGGSGNGGANTGDGSTGNGSTGAGSGDSAGAGDTDPAGSGDGSGSATGDGASTESIVIIDGTPVTIDTVTGLPATGDGQGVNTSGIGGTTALALAGFALLSMFGVAMVRVNARAQG